MNADNGEDGHHPEFAAALAENDYGALIRIALTARADADEGRYCECAEPTTAGLDLMCARCLLNNRDQEIRRLLTIYGAHDFDPDVSSPTRIAMDWCACTWPEDDDRHHGTDLPFKASWGEWFQPPHDDLRTVYFGGKGQ